MKAKFRQVKFLQVWALLSTALALVLFMFQGFHYGACPYVEFHGGLPVKSHKGSCWCGADDHYCLCTPSLAIDAIIEANDSVKMEVYIILVVRSDPPKNMYAIPGGFVSIGETVENATIREVKEETNLTVLHVEQFRMYSDPLRDKRRHTVSMVFRCVVNDVSTLHTGDDAKKALLVPLSNALNLNLAFDHRTILKDYIRNYHPNLL